MKNEIDSSNLMAFSSKIKYAIITKQSIKSGYYHCKIVTACPQHTNEICNEFTSDELSTLQNYKVFVVKSMPSD